jgi:membrane protease subunit (stomatin/prohibitin family)
MKPLVASKTTAEDLRDMGLLDVATYQQLQAADALRDAAQQPGGEAGTGVGLGAGLSLGQAMVGMLGGQQPASADDAMKIAKERLAKGEITVEEFEQIKKALEG